MGEPADYWVRLLFLVDVDMKEREVGGRRAYCIGYWICVMCSDVM